MGGGAQKWDFRKDDRLSEDRPPTAPPQYLCAPALPLPGFPAASRRDRTRREDGRTNAVLPVRHESDTWRHIGAIADGVIHRIGRRSISFHLNRAAETTGDEALMALAEADGIRQSLGLSWGQYVAGLDVSAREAA